MGAVNYYLTPDNKNPVKDFIESLQKTQKAKIFRIFSYIQTYGLISVVSHVKKLTGTPLWEIRILGKDNIRIIYLIQQKDMILVLHGFVKKTQRTPDREIEIALKRYKEFVDK